MKCFISSAVLLVFTVAFATGVWAEGVPWMGGGNKDATTVAPGDLKADLPPAHYDRIIKPIETRIALAEKAMEAYEKEMQKPAEKRQEAHLAKCKERAAESYFAASQAAKRAIHLVKEDSHKAAIKQQYEAPNKQKAIDIYLQLALDAHAKRDLRRAVAYYKRVLAIDAENVRAKDALVKLAEQYEQALKDAKAGGSKGGGSDREKSWDRDWKDTGRGYDDFGDWRRYAPGAW